MPAESHSATAAVAQMNQVSMWLFVICQLVQPDSIFGQAIKGQLNKRGPEQEEWLVLNFEFNGQLTIALTLLTIKLQTIWLWIIEFWNNFVLLLCTFRKS